MKLNRTKQCAKCPWKTSTDPHEIPNGYCETKHANLKNTIAEEGRLNLGKLNVMSCHHEKENENMHCVGWLVNQLGSGNNIGLRIQMMRCDNAKDIEVFGEQHEIFEDTLPF